MKFIKYKVIAEAGERSGKTAVCDVCRCEYTDNLETDVVTCPLCAMGKADGINEIIEDKTSKPTSKRKLTARSLGIDDK